MATLRERLRHAQYDQIYVSPHMDDAAYSCGGRILQERARGARVLVITVFGTGQGASGGGRGPLADYAQRAADEEAVMDALDVDYVWLDYPELLFRPKQVGELVRFLVPYLPLPPSPLGAALFELVGGLLEQRLAPGGCVFFPLGIGFHPDHRVLTEVGRALHGLGLFTVCFYEDVPYSTVPELVALRLATLGLGPEPALVAAAQALRRFAFRTQGAVGWLALPFLWLYLLGLRIVGVLSGARDVRAGEPAPVRSERDVADVELRKVEIMRLYPSQTALFFEPGEATLRALRREGGHFEFDWSFPAFGERWARIDGGLRARAERLVARFGADEPLQRRT